MLVSKNPYVVEARQNLTSKNPHFALKTGEKIPQTSRLKSLIFIVEKYGKKLLFKQKQTYHRNTKTKEAVWWIGIKQPP